MLNKKDLKILVELRKDARAQLTEISKKTSIPISTIYDRLKNKSIDVIEKNICILNFDKLGFNTRAKICLKCGKTSKKEIVDYLSKHQNVNSIYKINNGYDYMLDVVFRNIKDLEEFLEKLDEKFVIKSKQIFYIIENIQVEKFFSDQIYLDLL